MKVVAGAVSCRWSSSDEAIMRYGFKVIGTTEKCTDRFYVITGERN